MIKYSLTFLPLFFAVNIFGQNVFEKLTGGWETKAFGGQLHTYWQADDGGGYSGSGIFLEGADTTYREYLHLFQLNDDWILVASPEGSDPFVFRAVSIKNNEVVFKNERFQNPQNVLYRIEPDGTFYRRTNGRNDDGSPAQNEYFFKKMGAANSAPQFNFPTKKSIGKKAALLAPDIISSDMPEFATTVSPDGQLLFFNRATADRSKMYLMFSRRKNEQWGEPENVPFSDGTYRDVDPAITPDGSYLFFCSDRPLKSRSGDDFNIWVAPIKDGEIGNPQALTQNVNTINTEIFCSITDDGHLYFSRRGENMRDVIRCELKDKKYQPGEIMELNTGDARVGNPMVSPDEKYIIFNADGLEGFGEADLYICWKNTDGTWSNPINMGPEINSEYVEFAPSIAHDGQYLYFTSERPGVVNEEYEKGKRRPGDLYEIYLPPILKKLKN